MDIMMERGEPYDCAREDSGNYGVEQQKKAHTVGVTVDAAQKIADALNVSLWTLLNGEALAVTSMDLTERERRLVSGYRRLNDEQRAAVDQLLQAMGPDPK